MRTLIIGAILLATAPAIAQPGHTLPMSGDWRGMGFQVGPDGVQASWDIELAIKPDLSGVIAYPSLGCKGSLHRNASTSSQIVFIEKIAEGDCIDGGRISATLENGRIFWFWTKRGVSADASAVLYRGQPIG